MLRASRRIFPVSLSRNQHITVFVRYQCTPSEKEVSKFIQICKEKNFSQARSILETTSCQKTKTEFYGHLVYYLGQSKRIRECIELFNKASYERLVTASTKNKYMFALCNSNMIKEAEEYFRQDPNNQTVDAYNVLITTYCRGNDISKASNLLKEMVQRDIKPNAYSMSPIMAYFARTNQLERVKELEAAMSKMNISKNIVIYNNIAQALSKRGQVDEILQLIEEMNLSNIEPDAQTISHLILAFSVSGRQEEALQYFEAYRRVHKLDTVLYSKVMATLGKSGDYTGMLQVFNSLQESELTPDKITYQIIISNLIKDVGNSQEVLKILEQAHNDGLVLDTILYNTTLKMLLVNHLGDLADKVFTMMNNVGVSYSGYTYSIAIGRKLYLTDFDAAGDLAKEAQTKDLLDENTAFLIFNKASRHGKIFKIQKLSKRGIIKPNWEIVDLILDANGREVSMKAKVQVAVEYVRNNNLPAKVEEYERLFDKLSYLKQDEAMQKLWEHIQPLKLSFGTRTNEMLQRKGLMK